MVGSSMKMYSYYPYKGTGTGSDHRFNTSANSEAIWLRIHWVKWCMTTLVVIAVMYTILLLTFVQVGNRIHHSWVSACKVLMHAVTGKHCQKETSVNKFILLHYIHFYSNSNTTGFTVYSNKNFVPVYSAMPSWI